MTAVSTQQTPAAVYAGTVQSEHETRLAFRASGQVIDRTAEVGDMLTAGQVIMRLDPGDAGLGVTSASATAAAAQVGAEAQAKDLQRAKSLLSEGFISQSEFDQKASAAASAEAQLKSTRAQREGATRQLGYTVLKAPYGGILSSVTAEVGSVVGAGQPVAIVSDPKRFEIAVSVPEDQLDLIRSSPAISVSLWADPSRKYVGQLRTLSSVANAQTRTFDARITIAAPDKIIRLGQTAQVMVARSEGKPTFRVPLTAVDQRDAKPRLWIYDLKRSIVTPRTVVLAGADKASALVASGLQPGEQVVVAGVHILQPGQTVRQMPTSHGGDQ
ncbi:MAG: efflux RND transporter periplasmic adaptor subunit [Caulobacteraceae bacterium]|nr:efflux RND transporter periplasmic adaptor subunit [Caulobacteraceae bacterium]